MGEAVKSPLKRIFKDLIPNAIIKREKIGFPVPLEIIFDKKEDHISFMDSWLEYNMNEIKYNIKGE